MSNVSVVNETGCCPKFDPKPWDEKEIEWDHKPFIKDRVWSFFYMPVNFGHVMKRIDEKLKMAAVENPDRMGLSDHTSKWNIDVYVAVNKSLPKAENVTISGRFLSKVYEGPYKDASKWTKDFEAYAKSKGEEIIKWYMWYTTCPGCAKIYGKNYTVILGQV